MLSQNKRASILEDIEWARLELDKGSVYHQRWAQKYITDCNALLDEVLRLESRLETYDKQAEDRPSRIKLEVEHRADEIMEESEK